ncbi:hypothetical protein QVD17_01023 [Tagetes erecta]|uniref:Uncharacterized protein n=1 Tax=Tagetes erecta TaxID=13708 RepID=A0AAD8L5M8_TARER|nr:hypothetical protein QVD17_01023 [Tagetes erecta]
MTPKNFSLHGRLEPTIVVNGLEYLDLGWNDFNGTIPRELGNLTNLQVLSLEGLRKCGTETLDWLSRLSQLEDLGLSNLDLSLNKLDGIPKYLGNLCSLTTLNFYFNSMPVHFPDFLSNLSGCTSFTLQNLVASGSQLIGSFSNDIERFSSMKYLSLSNNQLNGTISEKVWHLPRLQRLDFSYNSLKGAISEYIGKTKISVIDLSNNPLEGVPFKAHMSNISNVKEIDLSSCKLGPRFPKWIHMLKNLSRIDIANTGISDTIPEDFWNMWPSQLTYMNLSSNNITGKLIDLLSNFGSEPPTLDLSSNNFYGPIPNVSSALQWLDLSKNKFNGKINFVCQIVDGFLFFLDLSQNSFTGQIPDCLWHFKELKLLSLGNNNLFGRLPASIKYLFNLEIMYLYNNSLSGELPLSLKKCTSLTFLELGSNNFSGHIPVWIGENLPGLYTLSLTSNNFFGTIPSQLCYLVNLQILDLSINNLYGTIPSCLNNLTSMVQNGFSPHQNVHYFNFTSGTEYVDHAMIKWQGVMREFGLEVPHSSGESEGDGEDTDELKKWFYIGGAAGFAIGFWIVCIVLLVTRRGKRIFYYMNL